MICGRTILRSSLIHLLNIEEMVIYVYFNVYLPHLHVCMYFHLSKLIFSFQLRYRYRLCSCIIIYVYILYTYIHTHILHHLKIFVTIIMSTIKTKNICNDIVNEWKTIVSTFCYTKRCKKTKKQAYFNYEGAIAGNYFEILQQLCLQVHACVKSVVSVSYSSRSMMTHR